MHLYVEGKTVAWIGMRVDGNVESVGAVPLTALVNMKAGQKAWVEFQDISGWGLPPGDSLASHGNKVTHFIGILISENNRT